MTSERMFIGERELGGGLPVYIVAEMSANHGQDYDRAAAIIRAAKEAGADAIKLQTYTPDTITLDVRNEYFAVKGTIWEGKNLYELYGEAYTPWEWHPKLKQVAVDLELDFFSTPFDATSVDFLEEIGVSVYKIASFELVDIPLLQKVASTGKPIIMSTGMAHLSEIDEAVTALRSAGCGGIALLKCTSAYPAPPDEANLRTITHLSETFSVPTGLSDHTLGSEVAIAGVALGACIIEKHFTLSRTDPSPDSSFSMEPEEFKGMVKAIRNIEKAIGRISYEISEKQAISRAYRRSLFVAENIRSGERFTHKNIRSVRPANGLHPRCSHDVIGRRATTDLVKGTPLSWEMIDVSDPVSVEQTRNGATWEKK